MLILYLIQSDRYEGRTLLAFTIPFLVVYTKCYKTFSPSTKDSHSYGINWRKHLVYFWIMFENLLEKCIPAMLLVSLDFTKQCFLQPTTNIWIYKPMKSGITVFQKIPKGNNIRSYRSCWKSIRYCMNLIKKIPTVRPSQNFFGQL